MSSFQSRAAVAASAHHDPRRAGRLATAEAVAALGRERTKSVLLFTSGRHGARAVEVAAGACEHIPDAAIAVLGGSGVVAPQGEMEGTESIGALALSMPITAATRPPGPEVQDLAPVGEELGRALHQKHPPPVLLFAHSRLLRPSMVRAFHAAAGRPALAGGGAVGDGALAYAAPGESPRDVSVLALRIAGVRLVVGATSGIRLLGPYLPIDAVDAGFVTRIGGRRPLDVLEESTRHRRGRPMVVVALEPADLAADRPGQRLTRGVSGLDPARGAIHVGDDIRPGDRLAFATIEASAAREDLDAMLRQIVRALAGGTPLAAVYVNCAARGKRLFEVPNVETRALRARLGDVPFAGIQTSQELFSLGETACVVAHTGVLAVLYAPS